MHTMQTTNGVDQSAPLLFAVLFSRLGTFDVALDALNQKRFKHFVERFRRTMPMDAERSLPVK